MASYGLIRIRPVDSPGIQAAPLANTVVKSLDEGTPTGYGLASSMCDSIPGPSICDSCSPLLICAYFPTLASLRLVIYDIISCRVKPGFTKCIIRSQTFAHVTSCLSQH